MFIDSIIKYYDFKDMFNLEHSLPLENFEKFFLENRKWSSLECSNKYHDGIVSSQRISALFSAAERRQNVKQNVSDILAFFESLETISYVKLNYGLIDYVLKNFDYNEIYSVICGTDFQHNITQSRVKIYFTFKRFTKKIYDIIDMHGWVQKSTELYEIVNKPYQLIGIELSFSNTTRFKLYPRFSQYDFGSLKKLFDKKIFSMFKRCFGMCISYDKDFDTIIHFCPKNTDNFIKSLGNHDISSINKIYNDNGYRIRYIALLEKELLENKFSTGNFYC